MIIDDFIDMIDKDECCVHHTMLYKYGVLTDKKHDVYKVERLLSKQVFKYTENLDFIKIQDHYEPFPQLGERDKVQDEEDSTSQNKVLSPKSGGGLDYLLKPEIFKMILMRSRNTRKYTHYDLLLENV